MRKIIFILCVVIIILLPLTALKFVNDLAYRYSQQTVQYLTHQKDFKKFTLQQLSFGDARIAFPKTLVWENVSADFIIKDRPAYLKNPGIMVRADKLTLELTDIFKRRFVFFGNGVSASPMSISDDDGPGANERLEQGSLRFYFVMDFMDPAKAKSQLKSLGHEIQTFLSTGRTALPIYFHGLSFFRIGNRLVDAGITTTRSDDGYSLVRMDKSFLKTIADHHNDKLTDAEAELLSVNPFKMPKLIEIMRKARAESEKYAGSPDIPEDAYRHVLWSYLLTREFGPGFAEKVTDAHEEGDLDNTMADHRMDYNNNAIGRKYALRQYKEEDILEKLLKDPEVIFRP